LLIIIHCKLPIKIDACMKMRCLTWEFSYSEEEIEPLRQ